jgi:hypothetical protein
MIRPRYILCSEGKLVDRETGHVSYINVIDKLIFTQMPRITGPVLPSPFLRFFISAAWSWEPSEEHVDRTCEWEMLALFPEGMEPEELASGEFEFTTFVHRFDLLFQSILTPQPGDSARPRLQSGCLRLISRVRRTGETEWLSQEYAIQVEAVPPPASSEAAEPAEQASEGG